MKNTVNTRNELTLNEMYEAAGGHPFEEAFADDALYRAGVSFRNTLFGSDEFYVGSTRISKETARTLRSESKALWNSKYAGSADLVGYLREWKQVLADRYSLTWDGTLGNYKFQLS